MKALLDQLGNYIETWANDQASTLIVKNWGFAELVNRESRGKNGTSIQPIPITIPGDGSEAQQIALDDEFNFIFWIRVTGRTQFTNNPEDNWGLEQKRRQLLPVRIVIAHRNNLGENLVYRLAEDLPQNLYIAGFHFVFLNGNGEVDNDHETIHDTELGKTNYEKHRFTWNIYTINLGLEFIPCVDFQGRDYITDQDGNCLFA